MQKFYHLTDSWTEASLLVSPRIIRADDETNPLDLRPCVAVAPTVIQCVIGLGGWRDYPKVRIYVTEHDAEPAEWIFDFPITQEHRIYEPAIFSLVGELDLPYYSQTLPYRDMCGIFDDDEIIQAAKQDYVDLHEIIRW